MILIADGGSTKVDWIAIKDDKTEKFKTRTEGLNPVIVHPDILKERILNNINISSVTDEVTKLFFYGAGCGTQNAKKTLKDIFGGVFVNAEILVEEDMLAAVYAASGKEPAIVCILGTGSNSCYFDGNAMTSNAVSLGWAIMDEASGNYFGRILIRDYFYNVMPEEIRDVFREKYDLNGDYIKEELYKGTKPNAYLANHAAFMFEFKEHAYVRNIIEQGFDEFFQCRILPYKKQKDTPIYFIGSIAYFFSEIIAEIAQKYDLNFAGAIRRPIDNMIKYHKEYLLN